MHIWPASLTSVCKHGHKHCCLGRTHTSRLRWKLNRGLLGCTGIVSVVHYIRATLNSNKQLKFLLTLWDPLSTLYIKLYLWKQFTRNGWCGQFDMVIILFHALIPVRQYRLGQPGISSQRFFYFFYFRPFVKSKPWPGHGYLDYSQRARLCAAAAQTGFVNWPIYRRSASFSKTSSRYSVRLGRPESLSQFFKCVSIWNRTHDHVICKPTC